MDILQIIVFKIGTQCFGVKIKDVKKIVQTNNIIHNMATGNELVVGMLSFYNEDVPVYDLHKRLQIEHLKQSGNTFIIVSLGERMIAFAVDTIEGRHEILLKDINSVPLLLGLENQCCHQVAILDNRLILILDTGILFSENYNTLKYE